MKGLGIIAGLWLGCLAIALAAVPIFHAIRAARVFP